MGANERLRSDGFGRLVLSGATCTFLDAPLTHTPDAGRGSLSPACHYGDLDDEYNNWI